MSHRQHLRHTALVIALASIYPIQAFAAAGVAQFSVGDVQVKRAAATVALANGGRIESGDQITTGGTGRTQLRFTDGGMVSLQPNSQFTIARYVDAADGKQDSFLVDLARGGMRALTGLIGKRNRENYKVTTTTATIGIRGSGFSMSYNPDGTLAVTTELDAIEVCTQAGCIGLNIGESALVSSAQALPSRVRERAHWNPPTPRRLITARTDDTDTEGKSAYIIVDSGLALAGAGLGDGGDPRLYLDGTVVRKDGVISGYLGKNNDKATGSATIQEVTGSEADGDLMVLGKWEQITWSGTQPGSPQNFGFVLGNVTPRSALEAHNGMRAEYKLSSATPVFSSTGTHGELLSSSNFLVDFRSAFAAMEANLNVFMPYPENMAPAGESVIVRPEGTYYSLRGSGTAVNGGFSGALAVMPGYREQSMYCCGEDSNQIGTGSFTGFFGGKHGEKLGASYAASLGEAGNIAGAGVFAKGESAPIPEQNVSNVLYYNNLQLHVGDGSGLLTVGQGEGSNAIFTNYACSSSGTNQASFSGSQLRSWQSTSNSSGSIAATPTPDLQPIQQYGAVGQPGSYDFIGWGSWQSASVNKSDVAGSTLADVHYLVGNASSLNSGYMWSGSATTNYKFIGGSNPTATSSSGTIVGTINPSSHLLVNFSGMGAQSVQANLDLQFGTRSVEFRGEGSFSNSYYGSTITGSGSAAFSGMFVGSNAERAGIVYGMTDSSLGKIRGAAAFQTSTPPTRTYNYGN